MSMATRTPSSSSFPAALLGASAVVVIAAAAKPPLPFPPTTHRRRRRFSFLDHHTAAVGVRAAIVVDDHAAMVAKPARASARSIMEGTHKQSSGSYCAVPRCSSCTSNPHNIAEFLLSCNLCGVPLAARPSFIYKSEKAFCKAECRRRYLVEEVRKAREEKRRAAASELKKKEEDKARKSREECKEGSIFFICPIDHKDLEP